MESGARWRAYLFVHLGLLAAALSFFVYAWLAGRFLPERFFHCLMHDLLHLYCPLCGGTRAARALLALQPMQALALCPTVLLLLPLLLFLDLRALCLLCRRSPRRLLPRWSWCLAGALLLLGTALRNTLMLYGRDPAGELAAFWASRVTGAARLAAALLLFLLAGALFCLILAVSAREGERCRLSPGAILLLAAALAVGLLAALYTLWLLLLLLPLLLLGVFLLWRRGRGD